MKVRMEQYDNYITEPIKAKDGEIFINIPEDLYIEYREIEKRYDEMQRKINPYNTEYNIKTNETIKRRKIESLKKELEALEK